MKLLRKVLFLPAILLGMLMAIPGAVVYEAVFKNEQFDPVVWQSMSVMACVITVVFGILTYFVFRIKVPAFRLSPIQIRVVWVGAFLMGLIGTPLVVSIL